MSLRSGFRRGRHHRLRLRVTGALAAGAVLLLGSAAPGLAAAPVVGDRAAAAAPAPSTPVAPPGPEAGPGQWYIGTYGIDRMWERTTGKGVTVAVIDSGVNADHENLRDTVVGAKDFSGTGKDGTTPVGPEETIHHGTAVAGVIAGTGEGMGPIGVAPDADILSASMWLGSGLPDGAQPSRTQAAEALRWAVDSGAKVVNMSLGWNDPTWSADWDEAFAYAYEKDVVVVACVGNRSQGATQAWAPSTVPGVVGVGGLARNGHVLPAASAPGTAVDLMGPAEDIPVPWYDGGYAQAQGCSFAAPVVAGVAALLRSADRALSADQVVAKLESTAAPVAGHTFTPEAGDTAQPDPTVGHGRVDPPAALEAPVPEQVRSASAELREWVRMHRRDEVDDAAEGGDAGPAGGAVEAGTSAAPEAAGPVLAGPLVLAVAGGSAVVLGGLAGVWEWRRRRASGPPSETAPEAPAER